MKIVCGNCGYEINTSEVTFHNITICPRCGSPLIGGLGIAWAK